MLFHVLRFKFRDDVSESERDEFLTLLRTVEDWVDVCCVGQDFDMGQDGFTHVYCVAYRGVEQFERYLTMPGHHDIVARFGELVERYRTIDFSDDMDPELPNWMGNRLMQWMEGHPELSAQMIELGQA